MEIKLSKWQTEVWDDNHRFKVICAGRRSGKSTLAQLIVLNWATKSEGYYYIVSPTYKQAKSIHWNELKKIIPKGLIVKTNETELSFTLKNGSTIELKGAENPDALRGVKLNGLVIDEIASIRNWDWLWQEVLRPTLTDFKAPAIFISTPKGFNHFYELFKQGENDDEIYKSWKFTSYDNPYIPSEEIDNAKKELTEDTFAQEYMADFRKYTGLALNFDRTIHVIKPFDIPSEWQRGRGFDYGSSDPTASLRVAIDTEGNMFVERAYKERKTTIEDHANVVLAQDYGLGFIPIWGDPSGDQWEREFAKYGVHIQSAKKTTGQNAQGWVAFTVEAINEKLKPIHGHTVRLPNGEIIYNAPRLFFLDTPEVQMAIREAELLKWKETAQGQTIPILDEYIDPDGHSDLMACLRYLIVSYSDSSNFAYGDFQNDFSNWKIQ